MVQNRCFLQVQQLCQTCWLYNGLMEYEVRFPPHLTKRNGITSTIDWRCQFIDRVHFPKLLYTRGFQYRTADLRIEDKKTTNEHNTGRIFTRCHGNVRHEKGQKSLMHLYLEISVDRTIMYYLFDHRANQPMHRSCTCQKIAKHR